MILYTPAEYQHRWKGAKKNANKNQLIEFQCFSFFRSPNEMEKFSHPSGWDDFDSIICLSLTLIWLNNLIVVGNELLINSLARKWDWLFERHVIKTSNDMKTIALAFLSFLYISFQHFNDIMVKSIENSRRMVLFRNVQAFRVCRGAWMGSCLARWIVLVIKFCEKIIDSVSSTFYNARRTRRKRQRDRGLKAT